MTTCSSCGLENTDDHDFCTECRAYLRWDEDPEEADTAVLTPEDDDDLPPTVVLLADPVVAPGPAPPTFTGPDRASVTFRMPDDPEDEAAGTIDVTLAPGAQTSLTAIVSNQSGKVDHYELRLDGFADGWWSVKPPVVQLVPFGADSGTHRQDVVVLLHPPRNPVVRAGRWPLQLTARSRVEDEDVASAHVALEITPYEQFESRVRPERATGTREARYALPVRNLGNAPLTLSFSGEDPDDEVRFAFEPASLVVAPGEEGRAKLTVSAPTHRGAERERRLTIHARGAEQVLSGGATFVQRPSVTTGHLVAWRVALGLLASLLFVIAAFLPWLDDLRGQCTSGTDDECLRYDVFLRELAGRENAGVHDLDAFTDVVNVVASAGTLAIVLAVLVLLGLRTGAFAWFAGFVGVVAMIVLLALGAAGAGVWLALLAGLLAIASGILATVTARKRR